MTDTIAAFKALGDTKIFLTGFDVASPVSSILYTLMIWLYSVIIFFARSLNG